MAASAPVDRTSTSRTSVGSWRIHIAPIWCALLLLPACGGDTGSPGTTPAPPPPTPAPPPPPAPPAAPTGLRVSGSGEDFLEWTWNAVEGADGYDVQFSTNEAFTDEDEIVPRTAEQTSYRREDLMAGSSGYLRVRSAAGTGDERVTSDWSAHVAGMTDAAPPPPGDDHGDTEATATVVSVPSTTSGELEDSDDVDYFRFRLNSPVRRLLVHTTGNADPAGELFGPDGRRWEDDDSGESFNFRIAVDDAPAGTYYVAVRPPFLAFALGVYELHVEEAPPLVVGAWSASGTGSRLLDLPTRIELIRITGEYGGVSEHFAVWCGSASDRSGLIVDELMGTVWNQTRFSGTFSARREYNDAGEPCRQLDIESSESSLGREGTRWTITEVSEPAGSLTPTASTGSEIGDEQAVRRARIRNRTAVRQR